jgi:hypothetical protein
VRTTYKVLPVWRERQQLVKYPQDPDTDGRLTGSAQSGNPGWLSWCVYVVIRIHVAAGTFHLRFPGVEHEKAIVWLGLASWRAKGLRPVERRSRRGGRPVPLERSYEKEEGVVKVTPCP